MAEPAAAEAAHATAEAPAAVGRAQAEESVATRFTRVMNASTSPWGMLSDPPVVAAATAVTVIALLAALRLEATVVVVRALEVLAALPLATAMVISVALRGARARAVAWLASLPFPLENMNAVLNGVGEGMEITFAATRPTTVELNTALEAVSPDCFVTRSPELESAEPADAKGAPAKLVDGVMEIRVGVVDSKQNPARTNHQRFLRVRAIVADVLVPLHARHRVTVVRIK